MDTLNEQETRDYNNYDEEQGTEEQENEEPQGRQVRTRTSRRGKLPVEEKLHQVMQFSSTPVCVKGQEGKYLHQMLLRYQEWFRNELEARTSFDEVAATLEKMGRKREIREHFEHLMSGGNPEEWQERAHSDDEGENEEDSHPDFVPPEAQSIPAPEQDQDCDMADSMLDNDLMEDANHSAPASRSTNSTLLSNVSDAGSQGSSLSSTMANSFFNDDDDDEPFDEEAFMDEAMAIAEAAERQLQASTQA